MLIVYIVISYLIIEVHALIDDDDVDYHLFYGNREGYKCKSKSFFLVSCYLNKTKDKSFFLFHSYMTIYILAN